MKISSTSSVKKAPQSRGMSAMLRRLVTRRTMHLLTTGALLALGTHSAFAGSATWTGAGDNVTWNSNANWNPNTTYPNGTGDTATFTTGSATITLGAVINVQNILFNGAGIFNIGTTSGNGLVLRGAGAGSTPSFGNSISLAAADTAAQIINAPLSFSAPSSTTIGYTFLNNSNTQTATLTFNGALTDNTASNRYTTLSLDGSNTGNNTYAGVITENINGQGNVVIQKQGIGKWILSGANVLGGSGMTNAALGVQINAGTLSAQNNQAFGTSGTANANQVNINNNGTLQLANAITLDNGVSLNLNNGGTIQSSGTNSTNGRVNIAAAATSVTLSTVNAGDVFNIGNGVADMTGGSASTVLNINGPGTVVLGIAASAFTNTYAGSYLINNGTLRLGVLGGLGPIASDSVAFGAGSTGKLQLNGFDTTVAGLSTNATPGTAIVENGTAGTNVLTVNLANGVSNPFAGVLQDGAAGTLGLTKSGITNSNSILTLTGNNTYSGITTISAGSLFVNGINSGTGTVNIGGTNNSTLGGSGSVAGNVTTVSGSILSPGAAGTSSVGTLSVGSLNLVSGAVMNFDLTGTSATPANNSNDMINVTSAGGLNISGGGFNFLGAGAATPGGTYNLFTYTGGDTSSGFTSANVLNPLAGFTYTFNDTAGVISLTIGGAAAANSTWTNAGGNFSWFNASNWNPTTIPNSQGATANFTGTAPGTVTLDNPTITVGNLIFNAAGVSYIITPGNSASNTLIFDNGVPAANLTDTAGTNTISAPITLTGTNTIASVTVGTDTLTLSKAIGGAGKLTKQGVGTLALTGIGSTYSGGTTITAGTLQINSASSMGATTVETTLDSSAPSAVTLEALTTGTTITSSRNFIISGTNNSILVDGTPIPGTSGIYEIDGTIVNGAVAGALLKTGTGTLILGNTNTYTGTTTITAGTLQLGAGAATGSVGNGTGGIIDNAALVLNRTDNYSLGNAISGTGSLTQAGTDNVTLGVANTFSGATVISGGSLILGNALSLQNSTLNYNNQGGTLSFGTLTAATLEGLTGAQSLALTNAAGTPAAVALTLGSNNSSPAAYTGTLSGLGSVTKNGTGSATIGSGATGGAAYSGGTTVNQGTLTIGGTGTATGAITISGTNATGSANLIVANNAIINSGAILRINANTSFATPGSLLVRDNASITATSFNFGNNQASPGSASVTVQDLASLTVSGTFDLNNTAGTSGSTLTVNLTGGTLAVNSFIQSSQASTNAQNGVIRFNGGTLKALANDTSGTVFFLPAPTQSARTVTDVDSGGAFINSNGFNITIANPLIHGTGTPDGGLTKSGSGKLTLTGANTYTGVTNINSGTLNAGVGDVASTSGALGNGGAITFGGGTLQYSAASAGTDYSSRILNSTAGAIKIDTNGQAVTYNTGLSNTNTGGLTLNDTNATPGSLTLNGNQAYTGPTTVTAGTLNIKGSVTSNVAIGGGATQAQLIGNNTITGTVTLNGNTQIGGGTGGTLNITGGLIVNGTGNAIVSGTVQDDTTVNGAMTVASGTTLASNNVAITSTGTLIVNGAVTANPSGNSSVTIASGGKLAGTGTSPNGVITGTVADNGGTINPGNGTTTGTLTVSGTGNVTFASGSTLTFDFGNNATDSLVAAGNVTFTSVPTFTFTSVGNGTLSNAQYTLVSAANDISNAGANALSSGSTPSGYSLQYANGGQQIVLAAAPEPSQWVAFGLGMLGLGGLGLRARRRSATVAQAV